MKKSFALILVLMLAISIIAVAGCSSQTPTDSTTAGTTKTTAEVTTADTTVSNTDTPVSIRVAWWGDANRNTLYGQICDEFESANPTITTVREPVAWADYWDKLTTQVAGNNAADFLGMNYQYSADYINRGVLEELDPYVNDKVIDLTDFSQAAIDSGVTNDKIYMIAMGLTTQSMAVDTKSLTDLGVTLPSFDWTWDDLKTLAASVNDKSGGEKLLMGDQSGNLAVFRYWLRQNGADLYAENGDIGFTADLAASWFTYWKDLRDAGLVPDAATTTEHSKDTLEQNLFVTGKTLINPIPANQLKLYIQALPDNDLQLIRNPSTAGGEVGEFVEGSHWAIFSKSPDDKKLAAAKLINFWLNDERSIKLFALDQGVPASSKMQDYLKPLLDATQQAPTLEYVNKTSVIATATTYPPKGASEVSALFTTYSEQVRFDQVSPADGAEAFVTEAQAIVVKNRS